MEITNDGTARPPLVTRHVDADEPLTGAVANAVAVAANRRTEDLPPLGFTVDADAMESLFDARRPNGWVTFEYADHRVTVRADRTVEVSPLA